VKELRDLADADFDHVVGDFRFFAHLLTQDPEEREAR
jgi:hypothetical protein